MIGGEAPAALRRSVLTAEGWYGFYLSLEETRELTAALQELAGKHERPAELGRLEITVTPAGPVDKAMCEQYAELGVDRLVLLPRPDAGRRERHVPVPVGDILRTIDTAAGQLISP